MHPVTGSDLVPGVGAALAFIGMVALLGPAYLWIAALLALAVYFGIRMVLPTPTDATAVQEPEISPREKVEAVYRLVGSLPTPELQRRLFDLCRLADALLMDAEKNPFRSADSRFAVSQYMEVVRNAVERYRDAPRVRGSRSDQMIWQLIDGVYQRLLALQETLQREDDVQVARELEVMNRTLKEMDEVVVQLRGGSGDTG